MKASAAFQVDFVPVQGAPVPLFDTSRISGGQESLGNGMILYIRLHCTAEPGKTYLHVGQYHYRGIADTLRLIGKLQQPYRHSSGVHCNGMQGAKGVSGRTICLRPRRYR